MATQGLLSIVVEGKVRAKIVTGCSGNLVEELAEKIYESPTIDGQELLDMAHAVGLGGGPLVVQTSPVAWLGELDGELPELYVEKFDDPRFNPRWVNGTGAYTEVVELKAADVEPKAEPGPGPSFPLETELVPPPQWVVCAANRHPVSRVIVCGARHFDDVMRAQIKSMAGRGELPEWTGWQQGFIDQFGNFLTREEALIIATKNGQIKRRCGGDEERLYSENLY